MHLYDLHQMGWKGRGRFIGTGSCIAALLFNCIGATAQVVAPEQTRMQLLPRERLLINEGWRFQAGDPADAAGLLDYDVRPVV